MTFADHVAQRRSEEEAIREMEEETEEVLDEEDLYDSERLKIAEVWRGIQQRLSFGQHEMSAVQREIRERFEDIGFVVKVQFKESPFEEHLAGVQYPEVIMVRRCEPKGEFDHDQMAHEVRSDILGKNQQGNVQKTQVAPGWSQKQSGLIVPGSS